jgi:hypothetical protein
VVVGILALVARARAKRTRLAAALTTAVSTLRPGWVTSMPVSITQAVAKVPDAPPPCACTTVTTWFCSQ